MTELNASVNDGSPSVFIELLNGMWVSRAIQVAASTGLADVLGDGPLHVQHLAERTGTHVPSLYRLLRALASVGVFQEVEERVFTNTELSLYVRADEPASLYSLAVMQGSDWYWRMCGGLAYSVQTGKPAFDLFHGMGLSAYFAQHPEAHRLFQKAVLSSRVMLNEAIVRAYDFSQCQMLMEIAGGPESVLIPLLKRYPTLHGMLYDSPSALDKARRRLTQEGLETRCTLVPGDLFAPLPAGADAILAVQVLRAYGWEECLRLLASCHQALSHGGKLLCIEQMVTSAPIKASPSLFSDLALLVETENGCERTVREYTDLFNTAHLPLATLFPITAVHGLFEGVRDESL